MTAPAIAATSDGSVTVSTATTPLYLARARPKAFSWANKSTIQNISSVSKKRSSKKRISRGFYEELRRGLGFSDRPDQYGFAESIDHHLQLQLRPVRWGLSSFSQPSNLSGCRVRHCR